MTRFRMHYKYFPDDGWTMTLDGEVDGETLERAQVEAQRSLGMRLAEDTHYFDDKRWTFEAQERDGWVAAKECPWCGGNGYGKEDDTKCDNCFGEGYVRR